MTNVRIALATTLAIVATLLTAAPIAAGTRIQADPVGDSARSVDLKSARYTNGNTFVAFRWKFVHLKRSTRAHGTSLDTCGGFCREYYRVAVGRKHGRVQARLFEGRARVRCRGIDTSWRAAKGVVTARVPKRCIVGPLGLRMQVWASTSWGPGGEPRDVVRRRTVPR